MPVRHPRLRCTAHNPLHLHVPSAQRMYELIIPDNSPAVACPSFKTKQGTLTAASSASEEAALTPRALYRRVPFSSVLFPPRCLPTWHLFLRGWWLELENIFTSIYCRTWCVQCLPAEECQWAGAVPILRPGRRPTTLYNNDSAVAKARRKRHSSTAGVLFDHPAKPGIVISWHHAV